MPHPTYEITLAQPKHLSATRALIPDEQSYTQEDAILDNHVLVALDGIFVTGFARYQEYWMGLNEAAFVEQLVVDTGRRNQGIGTRLMEAVETVVSQDGFAVLYSSHDADDATASRFHDRLGFDINGGISLVGKPAAKVIRSKKL